MSKADERNDITVDEYIASIGDEGVIQDTQTLVEMMQRISGEKPQLYGFGTIGFGVYHYHYDSGRKGEAHTISFYPRKGKITVYLMDGTARYPELLARLGKHTTSRVCIYIKRLSDVDLKVLEQIVRKSYEYVKSQDGHMHRALG